MSVTLEVTGLCKTFRGLRAIDDVSFEITQGSITSIVRAATPSRFSHMV